MSVSTQYITLHLTHKISAPAREFLLLMQDVWGERIFLPRCADVMKLRNGENVSTVCLKTQH